MKIDEMIEFKYYTYTKYSCDLSWRWSAAWVGPNPYNKWHLIVNKQELAWCRYSELTSELLTSVQMTEESLLKLKS